MNTNDKIQEVEMEIVEAKNQVEAVIINVLERGDRLEDIEEKAEEMADMANMFKKRAVEVRKKMWWQDKKGMAILVFMVLLILTFIGFLLYYELK